jgi:hypothetical protein
MMTRSLRFLAVVSLAVAAAAFGQAQAPTPPAGGGGQRPPMPAPSNLKVLPKDMSGQQVIAIMRAWEGELGVECSYCHTANRAERASDANPVKDRARVMMKMTASINNDYLSQLTDPKPGNGVNCGTCHRGMAKPAVFVPPPPAPRTPPPPAPPAQ